MIVKNGEHREDRMRKAVLVPIVAVLFVAATSLTALAAVNVKSLPTATFGSPDPASVTLTGATFSGRGATPPIATLPSTGGPTNPARTQEGKPPPAQIPFRPTPGPPGPSQPA